MGVKLSVSPSSRLQVEGGHMPVKVARAPSAGSFLTVDSNETPQASVAKIDKQPHALAAEHKSLRAQSTSPRSKDGGGRRISKENGSLPKVPARTSRVPSKEYYLEKIEAARFQRASMKSGSEWTDEFTYMTSEEMDRLLSRPRPAWTSVSSRDAFALKLKDMRTFYEWDNIPMDFFVDTFVGGLSARRATRSRAMSQDSSLASSVTSPLPHGTPSCPVRSAASSMFKSGAGHYYEI